MFDNIIRQMPRPVDIAGGCMFLASAGSDYLKGAVINIDGGWLAR